MQPMQPMQLMQPMQPCSHAATPLGNERAAGGLLQVSQYSRACGVLGEDAGHLN